MQDKNILLVQFRTDKSKEHEVRCFLEASGLRDGQIDTLNAVKENFNKSILDRYDAIILGGCGEFYLSRGDGIGSWASRAQKFASEAIEKDIPLLGVCFGYQLLGMMYGGKVVRDESRVETGTFSVRKLQEADSDPLFSGIPDVFDAQLGHKDHLTGLNGSLSYLAESEKVHPQAFRVKGKRAWGVLFHPEMNGKRMISRIKMFPGYLREGQSVNKAFRETPYMEKIVKNFMSVV